MIFAWIITIVFFLPAIGRIIDKSSLEEDRAWYIAIMCEWSKDPFLFWWSAMLWTLMMFVIFLVTFGGI